MDKVTLANIALQHIGTRSTISDLSEDSDEAQAFSLCYQQAVDATLAKFNWGFARSYIALALLSVTPPPIWRYQYGYPSKALRILGILDPSMPQWQDGAMVDLRKAAPRYEVNASSDLQGNDIRVINCNTENAWVAYTRAITSLSVMPPPFIETLSYKLAQLMSVSLTGDKDTFTKMVQLWQQEGADAATTDASEGTQINEVWPDWARPGNR